MFRRLANSWELVKASWSVLMADKELVVFPIVSFIATLVVIATFAVPTFMAGVFDSTVGGEFPIAGYIIGFAFYVAMYTVTIFANAAVVGAANIRLKGGDPTIADGFRIAFSHFGSILGYALIAATVGMILRRLSERSGVLGRIVISLIGTAWNIATYLVVPVLVIEGVGPVDGVKRSVELLKKTWGEQLAGNFGIGMVFGWLSFLVILVGIPGIIFAVASEMFWLVAVVVGLMVVALMLLGLISSTLSGIYVTAVYRYATTGKTEMFDAALIENTFKQK
ncbi:MAG: DUF6159 family protein [Anaerolineae bacterium]